MIKILNNLGIEGKFLNLIKACIKTTANTFNSARLDAFPLRSRTTQGSLLPSLLFNILLEALARSASHEKELKSSRIAKTILKKRSELEDSYFPIQNLLQRHSNEHEVVLA